MGPLRSSFVALVLLAGCQYAIASEPPREAANPMVQADAAPEAVADGAETDDALVLRALGEGDGSADAIAELRARGRAGLRTVLAAYDRDAYQGRADMAAWDRVIDEVAAQRDARHSRLFWHEDLAGAQREAAERGVPVLSLRMLGDLREEYSCANSRMFRTVLYADPAVSAYLDKSFVLHWSSERNVPKVEIDFGDGRKLKTTITGNSAHYVLDASGRPLDVLPGLYGPTAFKEKLEDAEDLHAAVAGLDERARNKKLAKHHRKALASSVKQFRKALDRRGKKVTELAVNQFLLAPPNPGADPSAPPAVVAQPITVTKAAIEVPTLNRLGLGGKGLPGRLGAAPLTDVDVQNVGRDHAEALSFNTRKLVERDRPAAKGESSAAWRMRVDAVMRELGQNVAADTAMNEFKLHAQVHAWFANGTAPLEFAALNQRVYDQLFLTPATDPWLGLRQGGAPYDGLVAAGVVD